MNWKLAAHLDCERPYLSGLLQRFDEEMSEAVSFFTRLNPRFIPPSIPEGASLSVKGSIAAHSLAMGIASHAMRSLGKLMVGSKEVSIEEGALGLSYAMFIWILLSGYLKDDGVEIETVPLASNFAELFVYLDDAQRRELAKKGGEIFKDMINHLSDTQNLQEWHGILSKVVQLWLISATSDKRTMEGDEELREIFSGQLGALYAAAERTRNDGKKYAE
jgi:hypothetical protein